MKSLLKFAFFVTSLVLLLSPKGQAQESNQQHLPVVFAPGIGMTGDDYRHHSPLIALFKAYGYQLIIADTVKFGSIAAREKSLVASVNAQLPQGRFHLVAHSMGGLDARLAISKHAFGNRVASLTTIATPHRGTSGANYVLKQIAAEHLPLDAGMMAGLRDMTISSMIKFNAQTPNDSQVQYFSVGSYVPTRGPIFFYTLNPVVWIGHGVLEDAGEGDNDGLVSVRSAHWGKWLGTFPADHFSETQKVGFGGMYPIWGIFKSVIKNLDDL